jgi:hypothetical protein
MNDAGQVAFAGYFSDLGTGFIENEGVYLGDGANLHQFNRRGESAPDGDGNFYDFQGLSLNHSGQVAYRGILTNTSNNQGIFRSDGSGTKQIARAGQAAPDGNGTFAFTAGAVINDSGQVVFQGWMAGATGGAETGLFRGDGSSLLQIVRQGQAAPDDIGVIDTISGYAHVNSDGQVAFTASLTGGGGSEGVFLYDDTLGLIQVARLGDSLLGSTLIEINFPTSLTESTQLSALNDLGQLAYHFSLADGREGIALWSIPEPGTAAVMGLLLTGVAARRQRRWVCQDSLQSSLIR